MLSAMGQPPERALAALRFSLGRWTTAIEIDEAARQIAAGVVHLTAPTFARDQSSALGPADDHVRSVASRR